MRERGISRGFIQQSLDTERRSLFVVTPSSMRFQPAEGHASVRINPSRGTSKPYALRTLFLQSFSLLKICSKSWAESSGMKHWTNADQLFLK